MSFYKTILLNIPLYCRWIFVDFATHSYHFLVCYWVLFFSNSEIGFLVLQLIFYIILSWCIFLLTVFASELQCFLWIYLFENFMYVIFLICIFHSQNAKQERCKTEKQFLIGQSCKKKKAPRRAIYFFDWRIFFIDGKKSKPKYLMKVYILPTVCHKTLASSCLGS